MNVSVRQVYKAKAVRRMRPDLVPEIVAGRISLHEAWRIANRKPKETGRDRLVKAWNAAAHEDRAWFLIALLEVHLPEHVLDAVLDVMTEAGN